MTYSLTPQLIQQARQRAENAIREAERVIVEARATLADLDASERVMKLVGDLPTTPEAPLLTPVRTDVAMPHAAPIAPQTFAGNADFSIRNPFRHGTNKAYIWEVLDTANTVWLNANQIQERASELKGEDIPMSSISPMLSEMKDTYLERDGMLVALKERVPDKEAQDEE
jgi:hypothetical protein